MRWIILALLLLSGCTSYVIKAFPEPQLLNVSMLDEYGTNVLPQPDGTFVLKPLDVYQLAITAHNYGRRFEVWVDTDIAFGLDSLSENTKLYAGPGYLQNRFIRDGIYKRYYLLIRRPFENNTYPFFFNLLGFKRDRNVLYITVVDEQFKSKRSHTFVLPIYLR